MKRHGQIIEAIDLSGGYGKTQVFNGVTFRVQHGEVLAVLGQNGSGKSTLLKTITGFLPPIAGQVRFSALDDLRIIAPHQLVQAGITYCPQGGLVIPELTVGEHLQLGVMHLPKAQMTAALEHAWDLFPVLKDLRDQRAGTLSGGQRQQLTLTLLLAHRSKIWLLDEPTAGLAPDMVQVTRDFLHDRSKNHDVTIILVEHDLDFTLALADRIFVLREGQMARTIESVQAIKEQLNHELIYT